MLTVDSCKYSICWLIRKPNTLCVATEKAVYSLSVLSYMLCLPEYVEQTWNQNISLGQALPEAVYYVSLQNVNHKIHVIDITMYSMITHLTWVTRFNLFSFSWSWSSIVYLFYFFKTPVLVVRRVQRVISAEE